MSSSPPSSQSTASLSSSSLLRAVMAGDDIDVVPAPAIPQSQSQPQPQPQSASNTITPLKRENNAEDDYEQTDIIADIALSSTASSSSSSSTSPLPTAKKVKTDDEQTADIASSSTSSPLPTAKKVKTESSAYLLIGARVAKYFVPDDREGNTRQLYFGKIVEYDDDEKLWKLRYNDGDEEEVGQDELVDLLERGKPRQLNKTGIEFIHFAQYRMVTWMRMYPDKALKMTHYKTVPKIPYQSDKVAWKLTSCCKFGNVYRHLDSHTDEMKDRISMKLGLEDVDPAQWNDEAVQGALIFSLIRMAGFREDKIRHAFPKEWSHLPEHCCLPSSCKELLTLSKKLKTLRLTQNVLFYDKFQTQGMRWADYLPQWTEELVEDVVGMVRGAGTWKEATLALEELPGVGSFSAAQALCSTFFGVFKGKEGFFLDNHSQVVATMKDDTGYGPGPVKSLKKIFPDLATNEALVTLTHSMDTAFQQEGLDFPYLQGENGKRRDLTCVDVEHLLCSFHRYLNAKDRMKARDVDELYKRFQDPEFCKNAQLPSIKKLEMKFTSVDAFCQRLCDAKED